jgi:ABC-type transport system involved in multi-copper enzyme maturation permease subunit
MNAMLAQLWLWFWHLIPANPILVRVVHGSSRRPRHLAYRVAYLLALFVVVAFTLLQATSGAGASLAELAKGASQTFKFASMTQLGLIAFLAPTFTASAITQERDAQTYNILLTTPLSSAQIVFGSLLSRLFFVFMLLLAGLPIFLITMVYGGVTTSQVFESFALSGATAFLTGSLAIATAMARVGTRRTIFSFYLLIALYLLIVYMLGQWEGTWVAEASASVDGRKMSWLTPLHPFLALQVALNQVEAPTPGQLGSYGAIARFALANPSTCYILWTTVAGLALTSLSVAFVRRSAKMGEPTFFSRFSSWLGRAPAGERKRPPRNVWNNPIAWREAKTKASDGGWLRWLVIAVGFAGAVFLFIRYDGGLAAATDLETTGVIAQKVLGGASEEQLADRALAIKQQTLRRNLSFIFLVQFVIAVLIATNTAATSMTKEREARTFDMLLTTLLTSKYIIWGKLRGLVSFCAPLVAGPALLLLAFGLFGLIASGLRAAVAVEGAVLVAALMLVFIAFACVTALQISLKSRTNLLATMSSITTVLLIAGIASAIGMAIVSASGGEVGAFLAPFSPLTAVLYIVDPSGLFESAEHYRASAGSVRISMLVGSIFSVGIYAAIIYSIYKSLVRNFDMIVRRQSGM